MTSDFPPERSASFAQPEDLAGREHWDGIYGQARTGKRPWIPQSYDARSLEAGLRRAMLPFRPTSMLEVGCGNSVWLPYLAAEFKVGRVAGLDYSQAGCDLARQRLAAARVAGTIHCEDMFKADPARVGTYDFVYSLGVVEHFTDLTDAIRAISRFVRPGGLLLTEVPNLSSIHGFMSWVWQPEQLAKHQIVTRRALVRAYRDLGFEQVDSWYSGLASIGIVAWEMNARWPSLVPRAVPVVKKIQRAMDRVLIRFGRYGGVRPLAPFLIICGRKSGVEPPHSRESGMART